MAGVGGNALLSEERSASSFTPLEAKKGLGLLVWWRGGESGRNSPGNLSVVAAPGTELCGAVAEF